MRLSLWIILLGLLIPLFGCGSPFDPNTANLTGTWRGEFFVVQGTLASPDTVPVSLTLDVVDSSRVLSGSFRTKVRGAESELFPLTGTYDVPQVRLRLGLHFAIVGSLLDANRVWGQIDLVGGADAPWLPQDIELRR